MHLSPKKQVLKNAFGAQIGDPLGKMSYAYFLQNCMILVKVGCPAVVRGAVKASRSFGFQVLLFAINLGFFGDTSTSITAVVGGFLDRPWYDGLGSELVMSSLGI